MNNNMRWFASNLRTLLLAFVLGVAVWVSAVSSADPDEVRTYPRSIPIETIGQDPALIQTNDIPKFVDVTIRAPHSVWQLLETQEESVRAVLDLSGLSAGEHMVDIQVQVTLRTTQVVLANPTTVTVNLEPLSHQTLPVSLSLSGQPSAGYQAGEATWDVKEVTISGPQSIVDAAIRARTVVNLDGVRESIDDSIAIQVIDSKNEILRGLTISPETTNVSVPISQQGGYRDVAVKVVVRGQVAIGYRLENISVFPPVITVFSRDPALVNALPGVVETQPLDLQDGKEDISTRLSLDLPENITLVGAQTVQVQVSISPIQTSLTLLNQPINVVGLAEGLSAQTFPQTVDVIVSGPLPVLDILTSDDITITVDVANLGVGTYQIKPEVEVLNSNVLVESILPETVEVVLSIQGTPTPIPPATPGP
jgi:YbbR domain-containing protein